MQPPTTRHWAVTSRLPSPYLSLLLTLFLGMGAVGRAELRPPSDTASMREKARYFHRDLVDKHLLEGLYVSIVPSVPAGTKLPHTVNEPGNVIHAGVWTGRYLAGVGYWYAATRDPSVRRHAQELLQGLRQLQEVTGKPGLLARGYVRGHGPVQDWERSGADSKEWHQGQEKYADYRWYGDVSVDNLNAVLYGYAIYFDLAATESQKRFIAYDVDRLMNHLLANHCRIIDVDGEVTQYGHVGIDPDPARDEYYKKVYGALLTRTGQQDQPWRPGLRSSLMLLPDLLIADHITGNPRYRALYDTVIARFRSNPDRLRNSGPFSLERLARVNHSSEGQSYEALYNLIRYERDPSLLSVYRGWVQDLWDMNWMEGNSLFSFMSAALLPEYRAPKQPGVTTIATETTPHSEEGLRRAVETLRHFPVDRVFRPVMNSRDTSIERNSFADRFGSKQSAHPLRIDRRPKDNEYEWKGNPYQLDGWLKPNLLSYQPSCDDPLVAWALDGAGRLYRTLDSGVRWEEMNSGLMGARVQAFVPSDRRTFVVYARTDRGSVVTRDGGASWRELPTGEHPPAFPTPRFNTWVQPAGAPATGVEGTRQAVAVSTSSLSGLSFRVGQNEQLERSDDGGRTAAPAMTGWRLPIAHYVFTTPHGVIAGGPAGCYITRDGRTWAELHIWPEQETGAADFLHAYWMGRYYGFVKDTE